MYLAGNDSHSKEVLRHKSWVTQASYLGVVSYSFKDAAIHKYVDKDEDGAEFSSQQERSNDVESLTLKDGKLLNHSNELKKQYQNHTGFLRQLLETEMVCISGRTAQAPLIPFTTARGGETF